MENKQFGDYVWEVYCNIVVFPVIVLAGLTAYAATLFTWRGAHSIAEACKFLEYIEK